MSTKKAGRICTKRRHAIRAKLPQMCVTCGATENLTLDHIVARCLGGTNEQYNLQILCAGCNKRKAVFEEAEFKKRLRAENKLQKAAYFREQARQDRRPWPPTGRSGRAFSKP